MSRPKVRRVNYKGKTVVVNMRTTNLWDECIDRQTIFGNPFRIGPDGTRQDCIDQYKKMFYNRIKFNPQFKKAVQSLKGKRLGCWCKPKPCHGDIIVKYLKGEQK